MTSFTTRPKAFTLCRRALAATAIAAFMLMAPAQPHAQESAAPENAAPKNAAQKNTAKSVQPPAADANIDNRKFNPPQDIQVVNKSEWSKATPLDAFHGIISSMLDDNPHWQAEATVPEKREMVRTKAGGKIGQRINKALINQVSRIAVMQVIQRGDVAIVIGIKEHKPTYLKREVSYSSDVFGFEKRGDEWLFHPRRSTFYPGCHVVFMGNLKRPVDHFYCLVQDDQGYFQLDASIQDDPEFNKAMFGRDVPE